MTFNRLAIVELYFSDQILPEEDAGAIEALLRSDKNVNNLSIHSDKMIFFIWGDEKSDYSLLDRIKKELEKRGNKNFVLSAAEYSKTGLNYHYDSRNAVKR